MSDREHSEHAQALRALEAEIAVLRGRLQDAPRRVRLLEDRLLDARNQLMQAQGQNERLGIVLAETREQLALLRDEVEKLTAPPNPFGTVLQINADGTVDITSSGRKLRVAVEPTVEFKELEPGQEVILNEAFNIVDVRTFETTGEVATIKEILGDDRLVVVGRGDEERVVTLAAPVADLKLRTG
ncbi:MAG: proteasome ATPase, partial [Actinomycetota bacterium]|nr:proteasome ATPase [Actinomycetota bacterium]